MSWQCAVLGPVPAVWPGYLVLHSGAAICGVAGGWVGGCFGFSPSCWGGWVGAYKWALVLAAKWGWVGGLRLDAAAVVAEEALERKAGGRC
jgi:hypothetical protein